eukprot:104362-Pelagomonas_calceolata.AAC.3
MDQELVNYHILLVEGKHGIRRNLTSRDHSVLSAVWPPASTSRCCFFWALKKWGTVQRRNSGETTWSASSTDTSFPFAYFKQLFRLPPGWDASRRPKVRAPLQSVIFTEHLPLKASKIREGLCMRQKLEGENTYSDVILFDQGEQTASHTVPAILHNQNKMISVAKKHCVRFSTTLLAQAVALLRPPHTLHGKGAGSSKRADCIRDGHLYIWTCSLPVLFLKSSHAKIVLSPKYNEY